MASKALTLLFTLLWSVSGLSQIVVQNLHSKTQRAILFNNGKNVILIQSDKAASLNITASEGVNLFEKRINNDSLMLYAFVYKSGKHFFILSDKNTGKTIEKIELTTEDVSDPFVQVGSIKTSEVSKNVLLLQQGLVVTNTNDDYYRLRAFVKEYIFKVQLPGKTVNINVRGPYFTEEIKGILKQIPYNTIVEFTEIRAQGPDMCITRRFPTIKLLVK